MCLPVQDGYGFLTPWQKTYIRSSRSFSVPVETDGHELTISLVSVDPVLFDDFIYLCHLQAMITHDSPEESIESVKAIQQNSVDHSNPQSSNKLLFKCVIALPVQCFVVFLKICICHFSCLREKNFKQV